MTLAASAEFAVPCGVPTAFSGDAPLGACWVCCVPWPDVDSSVTGFFESWYDAGAADGPACAVVSTPSPANAATADTVTEVARATIRP